MLALDYNTILKHQFHDVNASRTSFRFITWLKVIQFVKKKIVVSLNKNLSSQLIQSRGLVSEFTDRLKESDNIDLSYPIELIEDLIGINISLKTEFEKSNDPDLKRADEILTETIEHYYASLRILKRHNQRNSIPTSQIATDSCRHSLNTLQTVINGRRTT